MRDNDRFGNEALGTDETWSPRKSACDTTEAGAIANAAVLRALVDSIAARRLVFTKPTQAVRRGDAAAQIEDDARQHGTASSNIDRPLKAGPAGCRTLKQFVR